MLVEQRPSRFPDDQVVVRLSSQSFYHDATSQSRVREAVSGLILIRILCRLSYDQNLWRVGVEVAQRGGMLNECSFVSVLSLSPIAVVSVGLGLGFGGPCQAMPDAAPGSPGTAKSEPPKVDWGHLLTRRRYQKSPHHASSHPCRW